MRGQEGNSGNNGERRKEKDKLGSQERNMQQEKRKQPPFMCMIVLCPTSSSEDVRLRPKLEKERER